MLCRSFGLDRIRRSALETLEHVVAPLLTVPALDIGELLLAGGLLTAATVLAVGVVSVAVILAASEATRPLRTRLLTESGADRS